MRGRAARGAVTSAWRSDAWPRSARTCRAGVNASATPRTRGYRPHVTCCRRRSGAERPRQAVEAHLAAVASAVRAVPGRPARTRRASGRRPGRIRGPGGGRGGCDRLQRRVRSGPTRAAAAVPIPPHVTVAQTLPHVRLDRAAAVLADYENVLSIGGAGPCSSAGRTAFWSRTAGLPSADNVPVTGRTPRVHRGRGRLKRLRASVGRLRRRVHAARPRRAASPGIRGDDGRPARGRGGDVNTRSGFFTLVALASTSRASSSKATRTPRDTLVRTSTTPCLDGRTGICRSRASQREGRRGPHRSAG